MSGDELGILVDDDDREIGTAPRADIRARKLLHRGVLVVCRDEKGRVFVHRRTDDKDVFPGCYDCVVGGMVNPGETYEQAAAREVAEELGVAPVALTLIGKHRFHGDENPSWAAVFEATIDEPVTPDPSEIAWSAFVTAEELERRLPEWRMPPSFVTLYQRYVARSR